jgi:CheY-like chemotaxis protein
VNERPQPSRIATVRVQSRVTVTGVIRSVTTDAVGPSPALRCVLADGSGQLDLLFLGRESIVGLEPGRRLTAEGRAVVYQARVVLWNPRYDLALPEPSPAAPAMNGDGPGVGEAGGRVLVMGDDPGLRRVIEVNLAARGYHVETAATSVAAVSAGGHRHSLVIVDLGVTDAEDMASVMAAHGCLGRVPVLAVSARDSEEVRQAVLAAGATDFLAKPFAIDALLRKVERAAGAGQKGGERRVGEREGGREGRQRR